MTRKPTPGQAAHLEFHLRRRRYEYASRRKREANEGEPPFRTASFISVGGDFQPRSDRYPDGEDTAYMDARRGTFGLHEEDEAAESAFANATLVLRAYSETAADIVSLVCVAGRVDVVWGERVRHADWIEGARLLKPGLDEDELDPRRVEEWQFRAWEILGWVMLPRAERRKAAREHEESARVQEWLRDVRGA